MKKIMSLLLTLLMLMGVMISFSACDDDDDPAAYLDYGDDYYYDSGSGTVERSLHGLLNGAPEWGE